MDDLPPIDPDYSAEQREEIGRIDYLLDELRKLRDRGLVAAEAVEVGRGGEGGAAGRDRAAGPGLGRAEGRPGR